MSGVLVTHSPFCFLRQGLSLNPEPASSARLPAIGPLGCLSPLPSSRITSMHHHVPCFMDVGNTNSGPPAAQVLYPLSHLLSTLVSTFWNYFHNKS